MISTDCRIFCYIIESSTSKAFRPCAAEFAMEIAQKVKHNILCAITAHEIYSERIRYGSDDRNARLGS